MNLLAWVGLISCCEKVAFLLSAKHNLHHKKWHWWEKYVLSAEVGRDSGQLQVIDLPEWCVAYSWMSKSHICCRPGLNNSHFAYTLPLHSKVRLNLLNVDSMEVTLPLLVCVELPLCWLHLSRCITATDTEWGATRLCGWFSTEAHEAQRLWETPACSATAALIMAETLTVCWLSMLGPHFHSHYLQYPKPLTSFCLGRRRV